MYTRNDAAATTRLDRFHAEVRDAQELLEFAVATGRDVSDDVLTNIKKAEEFLDGKTTPSVEERAAFERAYRQLATALAPVTAATLRATQDREGPALWIHGAPFRANLRSTLANVHARWSALSEAKQWSRILWIITASVLAFILFGENIDRILHEYFPMDEESSPATVGWHIASSVLQTLLPFSYGALGSLAFLLRSCHEFIHRREFDPQRKPEYYNRILLGLVSGGAILLLVEEVSVDGGEAATPVRLSATALAFLAGYSTDFLFGTVERVIAAIFPKVGVQTVRRGPAGPPPARDDRDGRDAGASAPGK